MNKFVNGLKNENNWTVTTNGALALKSTTNSLVDLFGSIGSLRSRSEYEIEKMFINAFNESKVLATKMSFYARNIKGGLGERRTARVIWKYIANNYPDIMRKNIKNIPLFGRYDDLYVFIGTPIEKDMWSFIKAALEEDIKNMNEGNPVSLLAKWLKSVNTSSKESKRLGRLTAKHLGMSPDTYRRILSKLRRYIDVTERKMSANEWNKINYSNVPSVAMNIYRNAFQRNDNERFDAFIYKVNKGEEKINSDTLYPYNIVEKYFHSRLDKKDDVLEAQWKALPNYINGENNIVVMADVSGSMYGRPIATSIGLAIYFAERNSGDFHNIFMTFSGNPELVELKGNTLKDKIKNAANEKWGANTNIEFAFNLVLDVAIKNNVPCEDMPKAIVIISDMEFDECSYTEDWSFYDAMKNKFESKGYKIPNIIFWNVSSRQNIFHASSDCVGVQLASGQSASVFKSIIECIGLDPYEAMVKTLSDPVYDVIKI